MFELLLLLRLFALIALLLFFVGMAELWWCLLDLKRKAIVKMRIHSGNCSR